MTTSPWSRLLSRPETVLALALGIATGVTLGLYKFTSEVIEGDTSAFDRMILIALRRATEGAGAGRDALRAAMLDMTALGDVTTLTLVVIISAGFLLALRRYRLALFLVAEVSAGTGLVALLKALVGRDRPDVVAHLTSFRSASFPSGHAADSAIVYLSLAILIARAVPVQAARLYGIGVALLLTLAIGLSRLYLGVHWPSDVLAGWAIGAGWALIVALLAEWMRLRQTGTGLT